jgi:hypothetical protein
MPQPSPALAQKKVPTPIRTKNFYAYLYPMKVRLNLTIEDSLLGKIKHYAASKHVSVSELVEEYFKTISKAAPRKNILDLVDQLPQHTIPLDADLKKAFYEEHSAKHGF